jgi:hypothetical protein
MTTGGPNFFPMAAVAIVYDAAEIGRESVNVRSTLDGSFSQTMVRFRFSIRLENG